MNKGLSEAVASIERLDSTSKRATRLIAVDGFGGAGKSTFAAALALELHAEVVHTDDFASWDVPLEWWPRVRDDVLIPLSSGHPARYRPYDWNKRTLGGWVEVPSGGTVIIEGVSSSRSEFRAQLDFVIWVETPRDLRLRRGLERDGEALRAQWLEWMAEEESWAQRDHPRESADLVIWGGTEDGDAVEFRFNV